MDIARIRQQKEERLLVLGNLKDERAKLMATIETASESMKAVEILIAGIESEIAIYDSSLLPPAEYVESR